MRFLVLSLFLIFSIRCYGLEQVELQKFIKDYNSSYEKVYGWSKVTYALEKDLDDIALFYIKNEGIYSTNYQSEHPNQRDWRFNTEPLHKKNILVTCIRKNKVKILSEILKSSEILKNNDHPFIDSYESWIVLGNYNIGEEVEKKRPLTVAIEEYENNLEIINLLLDHGANLNTMENYRPRANNQNYDYHLYYSQGRPLAFAIRLKKYDLAKYFVERGAQHNGILPTVIECGDLNLLEYFLLKGSSPDEGMETAIRLNDKNAVILLLNFGANPLWFIDLAVQQDNQEIIDLLMAVIFSKEAAVQ